MNDWLIETLQLMDFAPPPPTKKKIKKRDGGTHLSDR